MEPAIICTLTPEAMPSRVEDWQRIIALIEHREPIDGGVRATFPADVPIHELARLVVAEQHCCQFFKFSITVDGRGIALEVRAPADALPIVEALFGESASP